MPDTAVVNVSALCTPADAAAGGTPMLIRIVLEIWPKAMPSAPSTNCAAKPIRMNGIRIAGSAKIDAKMARSSPVGARALPDASGFRKRLRLKGYSTRLVFTQART